MKRTLFLVSALLVAIFSFGQKVSGKINFKPGQQIEMTSNTKSVVTQEAMGQTIEFKVEGTVIETFSVAGSADGNSTIINKPKKVYFKMEGMGQNQTFDSDNKDDMNSEKGKPFKGVLDKSLEMTIDATGKIIAIKSSAASQKEANKPEADMMGNILSQLGSAETPKIGDASVFKILPNKEISKGESWSDSSSSEGKKSTTRYTLSDVTDTEILVDFKSNTSTEKKAEVMGMETLTKMNNVSTGKITIDKITGIMKQKSSVTEATGTVDVAGQSIPISSKSSTEITMK